MEAKSKTLSFICCYCRNELKESQIFEFRSALACEDCLKSYYRGSSAKELESQMRTRKQHALTWLARNRRSLERQAAKQVLNPGL
jgi:hypothetical protein